MKAIDNKELIIAINELEKEKGIEKAYLIESIETALLTAYKKNFDSEENVKVTMDKETGEAHIYSVKEVVDVVEDSLKQISFVSYTHLAQTIDQVMPKLLDFLGDSVLVAHNADFDIGFLKYNCEQLGRKLENTYIDTLRLAKALFPDFKKYKLGLIADKLGIEVEVAHRALDDVDTTVKVFNIMISMLKEKGVKTDVYKRQMYM